MGLQSPSPPGLRRWELASLTLFTAGIAAFAVLTEVRGAFQSTRKTDLGVYLRAGWAVRTGGDIYQATDDNGYHYTYPPAFAVVMVPLADAPAGVSREGLLPYPVTVALWTLLNFVLLGRMAHVLACLALPNEPRGSRRWWYARLLPFDFAVAGLLYSIGFGQVNVVLVWLLVEMLRCSVRSKGWQSGLWLAAAMTMKVIPAYILLFPLLRRDPKALGGTAIGLALGLVVIPAAGLGVDGAISGSRTFLTRVLLPGAFGNDDPTQLRELHHMAENDNQSFLAVFHHNLHPVNPPADASREVRWAHAGVVLTLTLLVVVRFWTGTEAPLARMRLLGVLMVVMLHATPSSHMHYYAFGYVLVAAVYLDGMARTPGLPGWRAWWPLAVWGVGTALPLLPGPGFEVLQNRGLGPACSLLLLAVGMLPSRPPAADAANG